MLLGLTIYTAAYIAEIVRAGIQAVPYGQHEAASCARPRRAERKLRLVLLPQALRVIIPPITNQYLNLTKNSSLAVAVGYPDLVSISNTTLNQTGRAIECIALVMAVYLTLSLLDRGAHELVQPRARRSGSDERTSATPVVFALIAAGRRRWRPRARWRWLRRNLFGDWRNTLGHADRRRRCCSGSCRRCSTGPCSTRSRARTTRPAARSTARARAGA